MSSMFKLIELQNRLSNQAIRMSAIAERFSSPSYIAAAQAQLDLINNLPDGFIQNMTNLQDLITSHNNLFSEEIYAQISSIYDKLSFIGYSNSNLLTIPLDNADILVESIDELADFIKPKASDFAESEVSNNKENLRSNAVFENPMNWVAIIALLVSLISLFMQFSDRRDSLKNSLSDSEYQSKVIKSLENYEYDSKIVNLLEKISNQLDERFQSTDEEINGPLE